AAAPAAVVGVTRSAAAAPAADHLDRVVSIHPVVGDREVPASRVGEEIDGRLRGRRRPASDDPLLAGGARVPPRPAPPAPTSPPPSAASVIAAPPARAHPAAPCFWHDDVLWLRPPPSGALGAFPARPPPPAPAAPDPPLPPTESPPLAPGFPSPLDPPAPPPP